MTDTAPPASPDCPRCGAKLSKDLRRDSLKPRVCPAGHGVFLEGDEVKQMLGDESAAALALAIDAAPAGDIACVRCGKAMRAFTTTYAWNDRDGKPRVAAVELDGCASCGGLWFDQDESDRVIRDHFVPTMAPRADESPAWFVRAIQRFLSGDRRV